MQHYQWLEVPLEQLNPLLSRQAIHSDNMTIARLVMKKGALVPTHRHENEQISMVQSGVLKFVLDGREQIVAAGETLQIPGNVPHSAEALEDTEATDVFTPRREDWIRGDDAYLRSA